MKTATARIPAVPAGDRKERGEAGATIQQCLLPGHRAEIYPTHMEQHACKNLSMVLTGEIHLERRQRSIAKTCNLQSSPRACIRVLQNSAGEAMPMANKDPPDLEQEGRNNPGACGQGVQQLH